MALSLSAEQKNITKVFSDNSKYFIPPYQRPYSWEEDQCNEFFEDLVDAYHLNKNDGYFLGNIILVNGLDKKDVFEVIDGQQRLTTITLFLKVLYHFDNKNRKLKNSIWILDDRTDEIINKRLQTNIHIENEFESLKTVLDLNYKYNYKTPKKDIDLFQNNICFFYKKIKELKEYDNLEEFINFFLYEVTMLPILSDDTSTDKAREKALKIFETINDRGKNLSNADILKSKLFYMANQELKDTDFIDRWKFFDMECQDINYNIDRIFKIYTYKIRGVEGIKTSEIGLREFFMQKDYSPFKHKKYNEIMDELFNILEAIKFFHQVIIDSEYGELTKWFQLINEYTNNYPKDILFVYLSSQLNIDKSSQIKFTKSLVRYCYFKGSTTTIKYYIYNLAIQIMHNSWTEYYPKNTTDKDYMYFGRLYKGFGLLGAYLDEDVQANFPYKIKRTRDLTKFIYKDYSYYDAIGHTVAVDKNNKTLENIDFTSWDNNKHQNRQKLLQKRFIDFFRNPNENI